MALYRFLFAPILLAAAVVLGEGAPATTPAARSQASALRPSPPAAPRPPRAHASAEPGRPRPARSLPGADVR